jgi:hypothetical protein
VTVPTVLLLASPDDFLLELERRSVVSAWQEVHPGGEVRTFDEAPPVGPLVAELANPSLFSAYRLVVVVHAGSYLAKAGTSGGDLAKSLAALPLADVTLLLSAVSQAAPTGALAETVTARGEVRFLSLPEPPKPWEEGRVSPAQRRTLVGLVARVAPSLAGNDEVVDALCEAYGFRPRELAHAAERLVLGGEASADAVRTQAGAGERHLREVEDALLRRDGAAFARFAGALSAGAVLVDWRGDAVSHERLGPVLAGTAGRLLRQALAVRGHAARAGLAAELEPKRCAGNDWYPRVFKSKLGPRLLKDIEATPHSPLEGMTSWQLHRAFRVAARYRDGELIAALARLSASGVERARGPAALAAVSSLVVALVTGVGG